LRSEGFLIPTAFLKDGPVMIAEAVKIVEIAVIPK
jgi:hypothetical protein